MLCLLGNHYSVFEHHTQVRLLPLGVVSNTCNTMVDFDICNIKELHVCGLVNLKRGASVIDGKS